MGTTNVGADLRVCPCSRTVNTMGAHAGAALLALAAEPHPFSMHDNIAEYEADSTPGNLHAWALILVNHRRLSSHEETGGNRSCSNHGFHFFGIGGAERSLSFRWW